jgi:hypothetical protein
LALDYARAGWPIFPVKERAKEPLAKHGFKDATTDLNLIRGWWSRWPRANIGIPTGEVSGMVVLDMDPRSGGDKTLARLVTKHGALPKGPRARTGGGGEHYLFSCPNGGLRSGKIGAGLDLKAEGGYIVAPPSRHPSGNLYRWTIAPNSAALPDLPPWLRASKKADHVTPSSDDYSKVPEGQRNSWLASLAGSLRNRGMKEGAIAAALLVTNAEQCDPPLEESEVRRIAKSYAGYPATNGPSGDGQANFVTLGKLPEREINWWWDGRIPWGMVTVIAGDGGAGKSIFTQFLGKHMTRGTTPGGFTPRGSKPRNVLILTAEENAQVVILPRMRLMGADVMSVRVENPESDGLFRLPSGIDALEADVEKHKTGLVIIDTGPALMDPDLRSGYEEDIRKMLRPLGRLAERLNIIILVIAHLNKVKGVSAGHRIMGGAAWRNAPRSVLLIGAPPGSDLRTTGERLLVVEKSNLGAYPPGQAFTLTPLENSKHATITWGEQVEGVSPEDLVGAPVDAEQRTATQDAVEEIHTMLLAHDGPMKADDAIDALRKRGFSHKVIRLARAEAGLSRNNGTLYQEGFRGSWFWRLPEATAPRAPLPSRRTVVRRRGAPVEKRLPKRGFTSSGDGPDATGALSAR